MNEEIKKLIEEEARICVKNTPNACSNLVEYGFTKGAQFVYYLCLYECREAERWRKFGIDDLPKIGMRILLRVGERYDTTVICSHSHIHSISEVFTEWKPIS